MELNKTDKLTYWILNLPPAMAFWVFGLIFPFYLVWQRQVGLYAIRKNNRDDKLFNVLSNCLIAISYILILAGYGIIFKKEEFPHWVNQYVPMVVLLVWAVCNGIVCKNMIDYENRENEFFAGYQVGNAYVFRFIHLIYFPLSIYWIQKEVNKYDQSAG